MKAGARRFGAPSARERREADLFLADLLGSTRKPEDASREIDGEDQQPVRTYVLDFIDQSLGGETPTGRHCAVICPRGLTVKGGELDMIFYLHGWRGTCGGLKNHTMQHMLLHDYFKAIPSTVGDSGKNVVFVAPTLGFHGEVGSDPNQLPKGQPWQLLDAALARVQQGFSHTTLKPGKVILAGHSGAGPRILALLNRKDAELSRVIAVWALDSFYGGADQDARVARWRNAIAAHPDITWTIVPSTGSDVNEAGIAIEAEQKKKRLANQRYLYPGADHCAVPAQALGQLLKDESRLTTRQPAPAPPPPPAQRPSERFVESLTTRRRLTGTLSAPTRRDATSRLIDEADRFYRSLVGGAADDSA
jgi:hypothetical protein